MRQGVLGVKIKIMQDWDPTGKNGPKKPLPDLVTILEPKEDEPIPAPVTVPAARPAAAPVTAA